LLRQAQRGFGIVARQPQRARTPSRTARGTHEILTLLDVTHGVGAAMPYPCVAVVYVIDESKGSHFGLG